MDTQKQTHPTSLQLAAFAMRKLSPANQQRVQDHLSNCADCSTFVSQTPRDTMLMILRKAVAPRSAAEQSTPDVRDSSTLSGLQPTGKLAVVSAPQSAPSQLGPSTAPESAVPSRTPQSPADDIPQALREQTKYRILRKLGGGGMGDVYEAYHERMDRAVAIKVINPALLNNPNAIRRFDQEIKAVAKLHHPNVALAYDAEEIDTLHTLVMELVPGQSLDRYLKQNGPTTVLRACRLMQQALAGLHEAFTHGIFHRDLKPQNLMLTPEGKVKILDFGLAKLASECQAGPGLTRENALMGTPHFLAPEQALDAAKADIRADIYSLGCTFYCLLCGSPPFDADTEMKVLLAHQHELPRPVCEIRPDVPQELSNLVGRMLAKSPTDRPQSPAEVAKALQPFTRGVAPAGTLASESPARAPLPSVEIQVLDVEKKPPPTKPATHLESRSVAQLLHQIPPIWRWAVGSGSVTCGLLLAAWAAGVFTMRTPEGTIVVTNVPADAEAIVDGNKVTFKRNGDEVTIEAVSQGPHKLKITRAGQELWSHDVTIAFAGQQVPVHYSQLEPATLRQEEAFKLKNAKERFPDATIIGGDWKIVEKELVQASTATEFSNVAFGDPEWSSYDLTLSVTPDAGFPEVSIGSAAIDEEQYRYLKLGRDGTSTYELNSRIQGKSDGAGKVVISGSLKLGQRYDVRIEVRGPKCRCVINGKVLESTDTRFTKGMIFLNTHRTAARFRDVRVTSPDGKLLWEGFPKLPGQSDAKPTAAEPPAGAAADAADVTNSPTTAMVRNSDVKISGGDWKIEKRDDGDAVLQASKENSLARLAFGDPAWSSYNLTLKAMALEGPGGFQVVIHFKDEDNFRRVHLSRKGGRHHLNSFVSGHWGSTEIRTSPSSLENNRWYDVRLEVRGAACRVLLDDKLLFETQGRDDRLTAGRIALRTTDSSTARFKDIKVTTPDNKTVLWEGLPRLPGEGTASAAGTAVVAASPNSSHGFISLFNGKDLTGWSTHFTQQDVWTVVDGVLVGRGDKLSNLYSDKDDFTDVHFRAEVRINGTGNSGIHVRSPVGPAELPNRPAGGYEAQICPRGDGKGNTKTGGIFVSGLVAPVDKSLGRVDDWFTLEQIVRGNEITVLVDGQQAAHYVDNNNLVKRGRIALEMRDADTKVEFRKIEIKRLDAT